VAGKKVRMSKSHHRPPVKFGNWETIKYIAGGGNGDVFMARNDEGTVAALKVLRKVKPVAYRRFRAEVEVVQGNSDVKGLLPIIDSYLPGRVTGIHPLIVTPGFIAAVCTKAQQFSSSHESISQVKSK
jgi:hypothetical protein